MNGVIRGPLVLTNIHIHKAAGDYTLVNDSVVIVNKTAGAATAVNLPPGAAFPPGTVIQIKDGKGDAGANNITVTPNGSDTIDSASTLVMSVNYSACALIWNGTEWNALGIGTTPTSGAGTFTTLALTGLLTQSAADSITAHAGGGQGSATALTKNINRVTTVATTGDSVKLPAATAGLVIDITNADTKSLNVFPATGDTINSLGANNPSALAPGRTDTYYCAVAGTWNTFPDAPQVVNTNISTVGAGTLTAAAIVGGVITRSGSTAAYSDTVDTAANIIAAAPNASAGQSWKMVIKNTVPFAQTILTAAGVTLSGQVIIPPNSVGEFLVTVATGTTVTIQGLSMAQMTTPPLMASSTLTTNGDGTILAASIAGGEVTRSGMTAAQTDTTDTAANIIAAVPNAQVGSSWEFTYVNSGAFLVTLANGASVTISMLGGGPKTVPQNSWACFLVTIATGTTVTMKCIAQGPNNTLQPAQFTSINVTTGTLAAGVASGAAFTSVTSTNATPGAQAMRTPAQILTDTPGLAVGMSYVLRIANTGAGTFTLATDSGGGFTMTGAMAITQNMFSDFIVTINTATTGTVQAVVPVVLQPAKFSTINVTTGTLAAGNASGAAFTCLTSTNNTPGDQAMRTPAQVLADTPGLAVGMSYMLRVTQTGTNPFTLVTDSGTGFTMTGTMTVAQNTWRDFVVTINSATTGTVQSVAIGTFG